MSSIICKFSKIFLIFLAKVCNLLYNAHILRKDHEKHTMKRIKDLRLEYGLNLKQLGAALGVSESTAQRYETEEISNLKYDTIVALANLFECTPGYLMGWDSDDAAHRHRKLIKVLDTLNDEGKAKVYEYAQLLTSSEQYRG